MQHGGGRVITASDSLLSAHPPQGFSLDDRDDDDKNQNGDDYGIMVFMLRMMVMMKTPINLVVFLIRSIEGRDAIRHIRFALNCQIYIGLLQLLSEHRLEV